MVVGLGAKAILFAAYVVVMVRGVGVRPVPFVLSFAGFFIALYAMEAYFLRQLFAGAGPVGVAGVAEHERCSRKKQPRRPARGSTPAPSSSSTSPTARSITR